MIDYSINVDEKDFENTLYDRLIVSNAYVAGVDCTNGCIDLFYFFFYDDKYPYHHRVRFKWAFDEEEDSADWYEGIMCDAKVSMHQNGFISIHNGKNCLVYEAKPNTHAHKVYVFDTSAIVYLDDARIRSIEQINENFGNDDSVSVTFIDTENNRRTALNLNNKM
jgi:hypothetical protein